MVAPVSNKNTSEANIRAEMLADYILRQAKLIAEQHQVPPGLEKVSAGELRKRYRQGTPEQKKVLEGVMGKDAIREVNTPDPHPQLGKQFPP